jgi:NAD(P)-dependent dehydrogenase (short-subunit alcohol dehydrogenase family)
MGFDQEDSSRRRFLTRVGYAAIVTSAGVLVKATAGPSSSNAQSTALPSCPGQNAPMQDVQGKVAFITGGSSGIGLGIAKAFTDAGMKVIIGYRTDSHLADAMEVLKSASDRVHAIPVDVTDRSAMQRAAQESAQRFGLIHVLVNNAGVLVQAPISQSTYEDWDWVMGVNLGGVFNGVHAFLPYIRAHGEGGQVITISSIAGLVAQGDLGIYSVSKFGVVGMMEALRAECAGSNIGVTLCCPGTVSSNLLDSSRSRPRDLAETGARVDPAAMAELKKTVADPHVAMDPLEVGERVLCGMRENALYILTHPEYDAEVAARGEALAASMPTDAQGRNKVAATAGHAVSHQSIYIAERDRLLCAARHPDRKTGGRPVKGGA